ncbi:MAG: YfiR family protein, partial [Chitinophagaceae bacterium]
ILFISKGSSASLKKIAVRTRGKAVLLVSESEGLAAKGSCINFVMVNDLLQIEINRNNIMSRRLSIADELLNVGIIVP